MKTLVCALVAMTALTGAASASTGLNERPEQSAAQTAPQTTQVRAGTVMSVSELARANTRADDLVTVTVIPQTAPALRMAQSGRDHS